MNYFTKEELEEITNKLLENPTRETLKELNTKYNGIEEVVNPTAIETPVEPITTEEVINTVPLNNLEETIQPEIPNEISDNITEFNSETTTNINTMPNNELNNMNVPSFEIPNMTNTNEPVMNFNQIPDNEINNNNINIPNFEVPNVQENNNVPEVNDEPVVNLNTIPNSELNNMNIPSFEVPKLNIPEGDINNLNNQVVNFTGNLWEPQNTTVNNLMDTTDNFNMGITGTPENNNFINMNNEPMVNLNTIPNNELNNNLNMPNIEVPNVQENNNVPINNGEFFVTNNESVNNPIPISGDNIIPGPTMFGQFEQNYNNLNS